MKIELVYAMTALVSAMLALGLTPIAMRVAVAVGLVDVPDDRKKHAKPTPLCGGFAVYIAFAVTCLVAFSGIAGLPDITLPPALVQLLWLCPLVLILGAVDDRWDVSPWIKLGGQILVACIAFGMGARFLLSSFELPPIVSFLATVLWIVGAMNAFNLIDGMDGLASGLAVIGAGGLAVHAIFEGRFGDALIMLALVGACLGFLRYNFHPAKAFLGDAGSMLLGFIIAWYALHTRTKGPALTALLVPILAMGIPILDTMLAIWRRAVRRASGQHVIDGTARPQVFGADRDHLHHRLQDAGLSQRHAAGALYAIALALVAVGLAVMMNTSHRVGILMLAFAVFSYVMIRHLARVELWDSGRAISEGLKRPPQKTLAVILYPPLDVLALSVAFLLVLYLTPAADWDVDGIRRAWLVLAPVGVGIPFLAVSASRAYRRVWSRARVSEYGLLAMCLIGGIGVAVAALEIIHDLYMRDIGAMLFIYIGAAVPGLLAIRVAPRLIQDCLGFLHRHGSHDGQRRVLLYGAGYTATLFLRECSFGDVQNVGQYDIQGFIDDDPNLHGRIVHSYEVLGSLPSLADVVGQKSIDLVIVTGRISFDNRLQLVNLADQHGFEVLEWSSAMLPVTAAHPRGEGLKD